MAEAEASDTSTSVAGLSTSVETSTEHEATSALSLLTKLRCPQPAAIARKESGC